MMSDSELPVVFCQKPTQHLTCPSCQNLYVEPVINIGCGHTFCKSCYQNIKTCPVDGNHCDPKQMVINRLVVGQIDDLLIFCKYGLTKEDDKYVPDLTGCQEKIALGTRSTHENSCEFMPVTCTNRNCEATLRKRELAEHQKVCVYSTCVHADKGCEFQGHTDEITEHTKICGYRGLQKSGDSSCLEKRALQLEESNKGLETQISTLNMRVGQLEDVNTSLQGQLTECLGHLKDLHHKYEALASSIDQLLIVRNRRSPGNHSEGRSRSSSQSSFRKSLSGSPTAMAEKWNMPFQFKCIGTLRGHQNVVWCMATKNKKLFSAGADCCFKVWDLENLQRGCIRTVQGHSKCIQCMCIGGNFLYTGGHDNAICCWSLEDYSLVKIIKGAHDNIICAMTVVGDFLFTSSFSLIKVWEAQTLVQKHTIPGLHHWVRALALNPERDKLYSGSHNTIDIWSVTEPFGLKGKVDHQFGSIYSLAVTSKYIIADACVYKGTTYHKGDKWDDGCDFTCTCVDETTGTYSCSAKCPTYTNIPPICRMVPQAGSCCQRVECPQPSSGITLPQGPTQTPPTMAQPKVDPNCHDNIDNCKDYGIDACGATYKDWAVRNCNLTCGFCNPMYTTAPPQCIDKLSDCKDYGLQACSGIYEPWALDNCRQYCGLCTTTAPPQPQQSIATVAPSECVDVSSTCNLLDVTFYCSGDYFDYALANCRKTCNLCSILPTSPTTPPPVTAAPTWLMLLKGVAGAPGPDLYQLWYSNGTHNPNVPQAQTHTASFNGHYKPDYSNHWQDLCIDQIKVAIYNQGIEKANIVFNATGADKMSWFTNDRIISSTWTDIKTAPKEIFSMPGDASKGREFYISSQSSKTDTCDSFGWIMISTKPACFFEQGDNKPSFYYAPGTSQAHWGFTNPGTGDVFVIEGHSKCPPGSPTGQPTQFPQTQKPAICEYKGKQYTQSQYWTDGCQYNCTCEDAAIGYYRCRNLCPQYTNLPPGCKLITNPGDCCAQPDCGMTQVSTIAPLVIVGGTSFCSYKGQYYTQDQTWNDGCSQTCTCTNADQGMYSCRSVCLNWNTLPSICHLEDAPPGLCCQQPRCPNAVIINIPKAYKDQYPGYNYV